MLDEIHLIPDDYFEHEENPLCPCQPVYTLSEGAVTYEHRSFEPSGLNEEVSLEHSWRGKVCTRCGLSRENGLKRNGVTFFAEPNCYVRD